MDDLIREYIPHAPNLGLYVAPQIPRPKLQAALGDYAPDVRPDEVIALFDATRLGSGKDGALFLADRFVFQNNNLQTPQTVRYGDVVRVEAKRNLLGGRRVEMDINRGRATVPETLDFSGQAGAAEYVERFLYEAMIASTKPNADEREPDASLLARTEDGTNIAAVRRALDVLRARGHLAEADHLRLLTVLREQSPK